MTKVFKNREALLGCIIGLFPIIPFHQKPLIVFAFVLYLFFEYKYLKFSRKKIQMALVIGIIFIIYAFSMFYTEYCEEGTKKMIRLLPIVLFPLGFSLINDKKIFSIVKALFPSFIVSLILYLFLVLIYGLRMYYTVPEADFPYILSYISNELWGFNDHPIYISTYCFLAIVLLTRYPIFNKFWSYLLVLIFTISIVVLSRKIGIVSVLIYFIYLAFNYKTRYKTLKFGILMSLIIVPIFFSEFLYQRFLDVFQTQGVVTPSEGSISSRLIIWQSCIDLIEKSFWWGYGLGSVKTIIQNNLMANGQVQIAEFLYNAHNQYLQVFLTAGFLGFVPFISSLISLFTSFIKRNKTGLIILIYFLVLFLFESFLDRQNGIIIYSLFISIFAFLNEKK